MEIPKIIKLLFHHLNKSNLIQKCKRFVRLSPNCQQDENQTLVSTQKNRGICRKSLRIFQCRREKTENDIYLRKLLKIHGLKHSEIFSKVQFPFCAISIHIFTS